jgi:DUF4097 and DUF4098 domain-containing protein YvlB
MEEVMQKTRPLILIAALFLTATVAHAQIELKQEHTFDARPGQTVVIDVSFHRVEVKVEPGSSVHALVELSSSSSSRKAEKAIEELTPVFQEKGDTLVIRSTRKGGWSWSTAKIKGYVTVTMPPDLDLSIDSSSGSITIEGDLGDGSVDCDASSGSITIRGAMRDLNVDTSSGSIKAEVDRPLESFSADASSGSIRLKGGAFDASVDTSSGSITLLGLRGDANMDASSGSVTAQWDSIPPDASIRAGASSGSVTLRLPPGTEITGTASTSSGGIRSDFPGTFKKSSATFSGGPGAVNVRVSTSSGSVKVLAD